jgi:hypothetical protein
VPLAAWLLLLLFTALLLALSCKDWRPAAISLMSTARRCCAGAGTSAALWLDCDRLICLLVGITVAWRYLPWYAAVIGGGGAILVAPLALQPLPDRFVDGAGALIVFGGASLI